MCDHPHNQLLCMLSFFTATSQIMMPQKLKRLLHLILGIIQRHQRDIALICGEIKLNILVIQTKKTQNNIKLNVSINTLQFDNNELNECTILILMNSPERRHCNERVKKMPYMEQNLKLKRTSM